MNKYITKILITIIITLVILILMKSNSGFKNSFYEKVYNTSFSFAKVNKLYEKYVGSFPVLDKYNEAQPVFKETLTYKNKSKYKDGVKLEVESNYLVPISESGVVVFVGEKDGYGKSVIIQRIDGIDELYGNIDTVNVELYDYVKKGTLLGNCNDYLYLVYKKDGKVLNYEEVFK